MISFQLGIMALTDQAQGDPWEPYPTGTFAVAFFTIIGDFSYAMDTMKQTHIGVALLAVYALVSQIMLVNLLIAMMGDTYSEVKDNSVQEWRFYRYILMSDYKASSAYPPPFNFIIGPFVFIYEKIYARSAAAYIALREEHGGFQAGSKSESELEELSDNVTLKKLKIAKERILEEDEINESTSMQTLSVTIKEHLRLMSNQRDSDRMFLQQHLENMQHALDDMKKQLERISGSIPSSSVVKERTLTRDASSIRLT